MESLKRWVPILFTLAFIGIYYLWGAGGVLAAFGFLVVTFGTVYGAYMIFHACRFGEFQYFQWGHALITIIMPFRYVLDKVPVRISKDYELRGLAKMWVGAEGNYKVAGAYEFFRQNPGKSGRSEEADYTALQTGGYILTPATLPLAHMFASLNFNAVVNALGCGPITVAYEGKIIREFEG